MSGKAGFAHGEPFEAHAVSGKAGFAHGRTEIRAITGRISAAPAEQGSERQRRAPRSAGGAGMFAQQTMREQGAEGSGDGPRYIKREAR